MFFRRKNIRPYEKASVIVGGKCFARSEQKLTDAGRPGPPEAYLSPFFVPSGDLDVPEGFSKNGDTLVLFNSLALLTPRELYKFRFTLIHSLQAKEGRRPRPVVRDRP